MDHQFEQWETRARLSLIELRKAFDGSRRNTLLNEAMRFAGLMALLHENTGIDGYLESKMSAQDGEFAEAAEWLDKATGHRGGTIPWVPRWKEERER